MSNTAPRAAVGIISIGEMGVGIAKLLQAYDYEVLTTTAGRRSYLDQLPANVIHPRTYSTTSPPATSKRATDAGITVLPTDAVLIETADYILSIVPPRDAIATANRIIDAYTSTSRDTTKPPLYFLDLNAIAPSTARTIESAITSRAPAIRFVDGGIIGMPPTPHNEPQSSAPSEPSSSPSTDPALASSLLTWKRPSIPVSGPHAITAAPLSGAHLATVLSIKHLSNEIGPASGLKASFAALTKGFTALSLQSYSTAHQLGVLPELQLQLSARFPHHRAAAERSIVSMQHKAYRWVGEMEEIGTTFADEGGWGDEARVFEQVAGVYRAVAEETALGTEEGRRGDVEGVVGELVDGLRRGTGEGR
ncbi:hypothetical protein B0J12DRAFT_723099 [Macrophomina phaseolina]|uniref:Phosphogluconate dehydrogenase NAD-binding putative C-terminal domain-containing protein n=1 Tax=Macrophomina phaseolina TaxID=35725 RepID=A0ABQ8GUT0_9PEZI|nr:hypothetical protein B0J12DRAFT_723099 [Macrophomina phaseolina]